MKTLNLKLMTAAAGAGALLAMGGLTVATSSAEPAAPGPVDSVEATLGETTTETTAPTEAEIPIATPEITGPAELPPEEQGLPG